MPRLLIHDERNQKMLARALPACAQLPFVTQFGFCARDYCKPAVPETVFAQRRALEALDKLAALSEMPFTVAAAFSEKRSLPHALGLAFDLDVPSPNEKALLTRLAIRHCGFCVLPAALSGERLCLRLTPQPFALSLGSIGTSVCLAQRLLNELGLYRGPVTGLFDQATALAVKKLRFAHGPGCPPVLFLSDLAALFRLTTFPPDATMDL